MRARGSPFAYMGAQSVDGLATAQSLCQRSSQMPCISHRRQHRLDARTHACVPRALERRKPGNHDGVRMRPCGRDAPRCKRGDVQLVIRTQDQCVTQEIDTSRRDAPLTGQGHVDRRCRVACRSRRPRPRLENPPAGERHAVGVEVERHVILRRRLRQAALCPADELAAVAYRGNLCRPRRRACRKHRIEPAGPHQRRDFIDRARFSKCHRVVTAVIDAVSVDQRD